MFSRSLVLCAGVEEQKERLSRCLGMDRQHGVSRWITHAKRSLTYLQETIQAGEGERVIHPSKA